MARPESDWEIEYVCMARIFKERGIERKCSCPNCTGKKGPGRPAAPEFPELLKGAVKDA